MLAAGLGFTTLFLPIHNMKSFASFGYNDFLAFSPAQGMYQFNGKRKAQTPAFAAHSGELSYVFILYLRSRHGVFLNMLRNLLLKCVN